MTPDILKKINDTMFMKGGNTESEKDFYLMGAKTGASLTRSEYDEKIKALGYDTSIEKETLQLEIEKLQERVKELEGKIAEAYQDGFKAALPTKSINL